MMEPQSVEEFYKSLLETQSANFSTLITVLLGLTALLVGGTWVWNFWLAKQQIKQEVKEQIEAFSKAESEKYEKLAVEVEDRLSKLDKTNEDLLFSIRKEFEEQFAENSKLLDSELREHFRIGLLKTNAALARMFANHCKMGRFFKNGFQWWMGALICYHKLDDHNFVRVCCDSIIELSNDPDFWKDFEDETADLDDMDIEGYRKFITELSPLLKTEKKELNKILLRIEKSMPLSI